MYFASFFSVLYFISIPWSLTTGAISGDAKSTVRRAHGGSVRTCVGISKKTGKEAVESL